MDGDTGAGASMKPELPYATADGKDLALHPAWIVLAIIATLLLFLFALEMMIASFQVLSATLVSTIVEAIANPFTGLFIGLLITAMMQSSSTTTAIAIAMVASGSITLNAAVPVVMGANVGTTITALIVSLGSIRKKKEFRRAVSGAAYHCFFNVLTVAVVFPLELSFQWLSRAASWVASNLFSAAAQEPLPSSTSSWSLFNGVIQFLFDLPVNGVMWVALSFVLLFLSILMFRRLLARLLRAGSPEGFSRFFIHRHGKSFIWGLLTTAAIRSSTITTSLVVPVVAKRIVALRDAAPFIMGANIGTTITGFLAVLLSTRQVDALSIAVAHLLFNLAGLLLFYPVPALRELPVRLSLALGALCRRERWMIFVFLVLMFFLLPFSLIYLSND